MSSKLHLRSKCLLFMIMSGVAAQMAIADPPIDEKQTAKGEAIYRAKCASCYGEKGEGGTKQYAEPLVGDASLCPRWEAWGRKHGEAWGHTQTTILKSYPQSRPEMKLTANKNLRR